MGERAREKGDKRLRLGEERYESRRSSVEARWRVP